ncbi:NAD(P)-dependent dehydrogenase (short-subunit alcohol dehydrogenase family) [Streptomyces umbrinus]|uniref:NAD(P)-dependent dehydrogenase (Short-subunit alcohol dehydrogenase family) n=1 Tax=Streptomyces umbrinus TaxID=67370 RepID=A0ABU0TEA1_9ACTN|nr:NAD(P)-dependent dehydrogenase (short-subunit alcohol dehydrogenase family) [Streptomyces umbrinus]
MLGSEGFSKPSVGRDVPNPPHSAQTPIGRLVTMAEIADATDFLLPNTGINAHDLYMDGGLLAT